MHIKKLQADFDTSRKTDQTINAKNKHLAAIREEAEAIRAFLGMSSAQPAFLAA